MHPQEDRETRLARIGFAHIFISYPTSQLGRLHSLRIIESRANFELDTVIAADLDSTAHPRATSCASLMSSDSCLCILELLDLQQKVAALVLVFRVRVFNHDSFSALIGNTVKLLEHVLLRRDFLVLNQLQEETLVFFMHGDQS